MESSASNPKMVLMSPKGQNQMETVEVTLLLQMDVTVCSGTKVCLVAVGKCGIDRQAVHHLISNWVEKCLPTSYPEIYEFQDFFLYSPLDEEHPFKASLIVPIYSWEQLLI